MRDVIFNLTGVLGFGLMGFGVWRILAALQMPTATASAYAPPGFNGIVNLELMHVQAMTMNLGIGACIAGVVMFCTYVIIDNLDRN